MLQTLERYPDHQVLNAMMGDVFLNMGQPHNAEGFQYHAVRLSNWTDFASLLGLVESLRLLKDTELGKQVGQKGLAVVQDTKIRSALYFSLGLLEETQEPEANRNYTAAADLYLSSAMSDPLHVEAWIRASSLGFPVEYFEKTLAENTLYEAMQRNPENGDCYFYLGTVFQRTGRPAEAIPLYTKALVLMPEHQGSETNLAGALQQLGRAEEAFTQYKRVVSLFPNNVEAWYNLAVLCVDLAMPRAAAGYAARAAQLVLEKEGAEAALNNPMSRSASQFEALVQTADKKAAETQASMAQAVSQGDFGAALKVLHSCLYFDPRVTMSALCVFLLLSVSLFLAFSDVHVLTWALSCHSSCAFSLSVSLCFLPKHRFHFHCMLSSLHHGHFHPNTHSFFRRLSRALAFPPPQQLAMAHGEPREEGAWWLVGTGLSLHFSGDHKGALNTCKRAEEALSASFLVHTCQGMALRALGESTIGSLTAELRALQSQLAEQGVEHAVQEQQLQQLQQQRVATSKELLLAAAQSMEKAQMATTIPNNRDDLDLPDMGFRVQQEDLEWALLEVLLLAGEPEACAEWVGRLLDIPFLTTRVEKTAQGQQALNTALVTLLGGLVHWDDGAHPMAAAGAVEVRALEASEVAKGSMLAAQTDVPEVVGGVWAGIMRLQSRGLYTQRILNIGYNALLFSSDERLVQARQYASSFLAALATQPPGASDPFQPSATYQGVVVISRYYVTDDAEEQEAIDSALRANLANPAVERVALLLRQDVDFSALGEEAIAKLNTLVLESPQSEQKEGPVPRYAEAFQVANELYPGRVCVVADAGVFFDNSLGLLARSDPKPSLRAAEQQSGSDTEPESESESPSPTVLLLSGWTVDAEGRGALSLRNDLHEAVAFRAPLPLAVVNQARFPIGATRASTRLVHLLVHEGCTVSNPGFAVHAIVRATARRQQQLETVFSSFDMEGPGGGPGGVVLLSSGFSF
jgi:tetratricopeptide (TPR) repeat protein